MTLPKLLALLAGAALVLASAAINVLHVVSRDAGPLTLAAWGTVACATSIGLGLLPAAFVRALAGRRWGSAGVALVGVVLLGAFSIGNAIGSAAQSRLTAAAAAGDVHESRARVQAELARIDAKLGALPSARPEGELQPKVEGLLASRRDLKDCVGWLPDMKARAVCVEVGELRAEIARGVERRNLEGARARLLARLDEPAGQRRDAIGNADAVAIAGFARALGWSVTPEAVDRLLILVAVATVEFGGGILIAVAGMLPAARPLPSEAHQPAPDRATTPLVGHASETLSAAGCTTLAGCTKKCTTTTRDEPPVAHTQPIEIIENGAIWCTPAPSAPESAPSGATSAPAVDELAQPMGRLLQLLQTRGEIVAGQRSLASAIGVSPSTMGRLLRELADTGRVRVEATSKGTRVRRVA